MNLGEREGLRQTLLHLIERCHGDDRPEGRILEDLAQGPKE